MNKIKKYLKDEYWRNIILNYVFRFAALFLGLFSVNINIGYLGNTIYGLWVTIASIVSWMGSADFGIGNGLRNELAKAYAENDKEKEQKLVATAFFTLSKISVVLFVVILILSEIFFRTGVLQLELRVPMYITGFFFCVNLCVGICNSIAYSYQRSYLTSAISFAAAFLGTVVVLLLTIGNVEANLSLFAVVNGLSSLIPNIFLIFILKRKNIDLFKVVRKKNNTPVLKKSILNVGLQFFALQLCTILLYSVDNILINYLISSEMVTKYSIISKVYDTGNNLFSILLIALWSAVTFHIAQNNFEWIVKKVKELVKIWAVFAVGVIIVTIFFNDIVTIWLGEKAFDYEPSLVILFAGYCIMTAFSAIFLNVMNGAGIIKLQLFVAALGAILNIPLSVIFAKYCDMGIFGIKLATLLCAMLTSIAMPIQAIIYLKRNISKKEKLK